MAELSKRLESFDEKPQFWSSTEDNQRADRSASLDDVTTYIYQSLVDYQSRWKVATISAWTVTFPYARDLRVGNKIRNITTGEYYTIASVVDAAQHTVRLSGTIVPSSSDRLELAEKNMVNFVSAYPQNFAEPKTWMDTVTYRVLRREPGTLQSHPFEGKKEIKPRTRQTIVDPDYPDHHIQIMGQWFDNLIQFDCWSVTNNGADSLISWFEDFLFRYTWVWKKNGVQEILYMDRGIDTEVTRWRDDIVNRTLVYYFRTEKIVPIRTHDFTQIDLYVGLNSQLYFPPSGHIEPSGYLEIIDGQL